MENLQLFDSRNSQQSNLKQLNHKERFKLLKNTVDEFGNLFSIGEEDKIYLRKKGTRDDICLGKVMVAERNLLYHKYEIETNIFRNTNSWTINYTVFKHVDLVIYETLTYSYRITKTRALEFGEIANFSRTETKINVPLIYWEKRRLLIDPVEQRKRNLIGDSWYDLLKNVFNSEHMSKIGRYLKERRGLTIVYPDEENVFRAFKSTHVKQVKVVILGLDPYIDGSANGLAFGFKGDSTKKPAKSLNVIFKEIERDCHNGLHLDFDNTLNEWANQGVLLLNTILTVERGKTKSHSEIGWQRFTKYVLGQMVLDMSPKVFMLWGNDAVNLFGSLDVSNDAHLILKSRHPAADLYNVDQMDITTPNYPTTFAGNKHFSQANAFLKKFKRKQIQW